MRIADRRRRRPKSTRGPVRLAWIRGCILGYLAREPKPRDAGDIREFAPGLLRVPLEPFRAALGQLVERDRVRVGVAWDPHWEIPYTVYFVERRPHATKGGAHV